MGKAKRIALAVGLAVVLFTVATALAAFTRWLDSNVWGRASMALACVALFVYVCIAAYRLLEPDA